MKKTVWLAVAFAVVVVGAVVYSTLSQSRVRYQVCISVNGRRDCRVASATSRQEAVRTAVSNACGELASGVSETIRCENTTPDSVERR